MCLGIPGQIISVSDATRKLGIVEIAGVRREVNLMCVLQGGATPDSCIGSWVLVHVGFAMALIDAEEAQRTMDLLEELGDVQDEIRAMRQSAGQSVSRAVDETTVADPAVGEPTVDEPTVDELGDEPMTKEQANV